MRRPSVDEGGRGAAVVHTMSAAAGGDKPPPEDHHRGVGRPPRKRDGRGDGHEEAEDANMGFPAAAFATDSESRAVDAAGRESGRKKKGGRAAPYDSDKILAEIGQAPAGAASTAAVTSTPGKRRHRSRGHKRKRKDGEDVPRMAAFDDDGSAATDTLGTKATYTTSSTPGESPSRVRRRKLELLTDKMETCSYRQALPLGEPVEVTWNGNELRRCYSRFSLQDELFQKKDTILLWPKYLGEKPRVAIIEDIHVTSHDGTDQSLIITTLWLYRPEEVGVETSVALDTQELYYTDHLKDVPAETVMRKCVITFIPQNKEIPSEEQNPEYVVRLMYHRDQKKLICLPDFICESMHRISEQPTEHGPKDMAVHTLVAERTTSEGLMNYSVLLRCKAITGDPIRDSWLSKLIDAIQVAHSTGSPAKDKVSNDNGETYMPDFDINLLATFERSTHDALSSDIQKYNEIMRQLLFNIEKLEQTSSQSSALMEKNLPTKGYLLLDPVCSREVQAGSCADLVWVTSETSRKVFFEISLCTQEPPQVSPLAMGV